ncbi:Rne/Rng family ribonuclease [Gammaproteobacteria bacterium]|nr:Rne/Rng family ribonuclease [Gammaproteobacteria bacterium]
MTKLMCINAKQPSTPRVAVISDQKLLSLETQDDDETRACGNIYWGTVSSIQIGIDAVFVDFGSQRHGFLPFKEIQQCFYRCEKTDETTLSDLVKIGQKILVQVTREEKHNKGAALTSFLSLAGAYLVLMPSSQKKNGISKKADAAERVRTKEILEQLNIPKDLAIIVRTEGLNRAKEELAWDLDCLLYHWNNIHNATESITPPALIHKEGDAVIRSVRDRLRKNIDEIIIDHEATYHKLKTYLSQTRPEFEDKIKLYQNKVPIFSHYGIQSQIQSMFSRKIELKSGGSIVIDYTEAMTVIDVNSARSTNAKNIEDTAFQTNQEALEEAIRQMSLRDIGGIIIIDFIDMVDSSNRNKVEELANQIIQREKSKVRFESLSALTGCMLLSRQRTGPSIVDQHYNECESCNGLGYKRSINSIGNAILHKIEESSIGELGKVISCQASNDVACYLLNEKRSQIDRIELEHGNKVLVIPNETFTRGKYIVKRLSSKSEQIKTHTLKTLETHDSERPKWSKTVTHSKPVVPQEIYKEHPNVKSSGGVIQRFVEKLLYTPSSPQKPEELATQTPEQEPKRQHPNRRRSRSNSHMRRGTRKRPLDDNNKSAPKSTQTKPVKKNYPDPLDD